MATTKKLKRASPTVAEREAAIRSTVASDPGGAEEALVDALAKEPSPRLRATFARMLSKIAGERGMEALLTSSFLELLRPSSLDKGPLDALLRVMDRRLALDSENRDSVRAALGHGWLRSLAEAAADTADTAGIADTAGHAGIDDGFAKRAIAFLSRFIDDDDLRSDLGPSAAEALLELARRGSADARDALRARTELVPRDVAVKTHLMVEPAEAFDELCVLYRNDAAARTRIAYALGPNADARWVDEAVRLVAVDAPAAVRTLTSIASPRAREELLHFAQSAATLDHAVIQAIHALGVLKERAAAPIVLQWLARPEARSLARSLLSALAEIGDAGHVAALASLAPRDAEHAEQYAAVLARIGARAPE